MLEEIARTAPGLGDSKCGALAEQEASAIAEWGGGRSRAGPRWCRGDRSGTCASACRRPTSIHLAAPFRVNGASPLFSPVLLAPDPANDGALEAREIMNLDLHAGVAVLSDGAAMTMRDAADEVGRRRLGVASRRRAGDRAAAVGRRRCRVDDVARDAARAAARRRRAGYRAAGGARQGARGRETSSPFYWAAWMLMGRRRCRSLRMSEPVGRTGG